MLTDVLDADSNLASKIDLIEDPFTVVGAHFIINKDNKDLLDAVNGAIKELKDDGTIGEMSKDVWGEDIIEKYKDLAKD